MTIVVNPYGNGFAHQVLTMPMEDSIFAELNTADNRDSLRLNRYLTASQWDALWEKNLPARVAASMADHDLSTQQLDRLLREEKRGSVLVHQFSRPYFTSQQQLDVLTSAKGSQYVYQALNSGNFDPQNIEAASQHFRGVARLEWITISGSLNVSDSDALETLQHCSSPEGYRHIRDTVGFFNSVIRLLVARPKVLELVMAEEYFPTAIMTPLASSRLIAPRSFQERVASLLGAESHESDVLAFVANPVVHVDLVDKYATHTSELVRKTVDRRRSSRGDLSLPGEFDSLGDLNHIEWVLRRALPGERRPEGRPHDLVVLARNPNLAKIQATRIHAALRKTAQAFFERHHYTPSFRAADLNRAFEELHTRFDLAPAKPVVDKGFWEHLMEDGKNGRPSRFEVFFAKEWMLDPNLRPWSNEYVESAFAGISADHMELLRTQDLASWGLPLVQAHAYMVHEFGGNTKAWHTAIALSSKHRGSLTKLVTAAKRLAR